MPEPHPGGRVGRVQLHGPFQRIDCQIDIAGKSVHDTQLVQGDRMIAIRFNSPSRQVDRFRVLPGVRVE